MIATTVEICRDVAVARTDGRRDVNICHVKGADASGSIVHSCH
jgi:hypothetical protein